MLQLFIPEWQADERLQQLRAVCTGLGRAAEPRLSQKESSLSVRDASDAGRGRSGLQSMCWEMLSARRAARRGSVPVKR